MNKPVKNTPPSNNLRGVDVTETPSHRERDDHYRNGIIELRDGWRIILCRHGLQFIIQKRSTKKPNRGVWVGKSYHTTRDSLIDVCSQLNLLCSSEIKDELLKLPEKIKRRDYK
jgi:hypothetical protein